MAHLEHTEYLPRDVSTHVDVSLCVAEFIVPQETNAHSDATFGLLLVIRLDRFGTFGMKQFSASKIIKNIFTCMNILFS